MPSSDGIERVFVASSSIRYVAYDRDSETLELAFRKGGVYAYADVPPPVFRDFLRAESKGRYFLSRIRDQYRTRRLR